MGRRALTAIALTAALLLSTMTPALAASADDASPGATTPMAAPGEVVPLGEPGALPVASEPRTGADVIGGRPVGKGTHGFVALIVLFDGDGEIIGDCTGTLIRWRWVLTAAHCLEHASGAAVVLRTTRLDDLEPRNIYVADAAAIAPNYRPAKFRNDIGLLRLQRAARIRPIKLAGERDDLWRAKPGRTAKVLGWGFDESGVPSESLRRGYVKLWSNGECKALVGTVWRGGRMLCAGSARTDVCYGDSGGPLLIKGPNRWIQHGVTSFGDVACLTGDASVYTRVTALRPWIERVTGLPHRP